MSLSDELKENYFSFTLNLFLFMRPQDFWLSAWLINVLRTFAQDNIFEHEFFCVKQLFLGLELNFYEINLR